jgi:hypothetical protein
VLRRLLEALVTQVEILRQYRPAVVTAEALVWHQGYKGLDAALREVEGAGRRSIRDHVRAELVALLAADRYLAFRDADLVERARMLETWSRRRGQMIRSSDSER